MPTSNPPTTPKIGLLTCVFLTVAVTIGNGIYTGLGLQLLTISHGFTILVLWAIGGLCALCGALSYAELASRLPHSGGEYYYLSKIYHPALGTMAGVITLLAGFVAPIALASMAFGKYLQSCFPACNSLMASLLLVTVVTIAHLFNLTFSAVFQDVITVLKLALIALIIYVGFRYFSITPTILLPSSASIKELLQPNAGVALLFCFYAYSGWNATIYLADDVACSQRTVGLSLVIGTLLVICIYLLINTVFLLAAPIGELKGRLDIVTIAMTHLMGKTGGCLMSLLIAGSLVAGVSGMIWVCPRMTQVMGKNLPALSWLSPVSATNVPLHSILLQYVIIIIVLVTSSFQVLLVSTQVAILLCSLLGVLGVIVLRYRESKIKETQPEQMITHQGIQRDNKRGFSCPLYPLPPFIFGLISIVALSYTIKTCPQDAVIGFAIIILGLALHPLFRFSFKKKN